MAQENKSLCPLCKAEIPSNSNKCTFCGALFVEGSYPFILKGIECPSCGHKNYSYDYCIECRKQFTVVCPMCNERIGLALTRCPNCGLKRDKFNVVREFGSEGFKRKRRSFWGTLFAAVLLAVGIVVVFIIFWTQSGRQVAVDEEKFENPRIVDANDDGKPERVEHFDDNRRLIKVEEDINGDGQFEKIVWLNPENQKPIRVEIEDEAVQNRTVELYDNNGIIRTKLVLSVSMPELIKSQEKFSNSGVLVERWDDKNSDGAFDSYKKFRADGTVWVDAQDSKNFGFIDDWKFYNSKGKLVSESYDSDGDGIFEKVRKYGTSGRLIEERFDKNSDGFAEEVIYYSTLGKVRGKEIDTDGDGLFDYFEVYTKKGIFVRKGFDLDGDGSPDKWE